MAIGDFVWADLSARDPKRAQRFYARLLGWRYSEDRAPDGSAYLVAQAQGRPVAAIFEMPTKFQEIGMPSFWMSYIAVGSAGETAEKAKALGARVEVGPVEAFAGSEIALIRDPLGAGFTVIAGDGLSSRACAPRHGEPAWNALFVSDAGAVAPFYEALLGWRAAPDPTVAGAFDISRSGRSIATLLEADDAKRGKEQYWGVYFAVDDLAAARAAILVEGGSVVSAAPGLFLARDPDGAAFLLTEG